MSLTKNLPKEPLNSSNYCQTLKVAPISSQGFKNSLLKVYMAGWKRKTMVDVDSTRCLFLWHVSKARRCLYLELFCMNSCLLKILHVQDKSFVQPTIRSKQKLHLRWLVNNWINCVQSFQILKSPPRKFASC